ncbi:MAG: hypothetical protein KIS92_03845 [Planctomycetota bacterium]|nr:hypothetical protein [Planctomycetota bacterium]
MNRWLTGLVLAGCLLCARPYAADGPVPVAPKIEPNPALRDLPEKTCKVLVPNLAYKADGDVLAYSGMVYDHHRHKILAFGGGHGTAEFPNSVHEFDFKTLQWTPLTPDVPAREYTAANAVRTKDGKKLGGVTWQGKISAGSRHTYDGLVMLPGTCLMASAQCQEFNSTKCPEGYRENYLGGSGLWLFDPVKKEWQVGKEEGRSVMYCISEADPEMPDWIYMWSSDLAGNQAVNWKTGEVKRISDIPRKYIGYASVTYCPLTKTFWCFPKGRAWEYNTRTDKWTVHDLKGDEVGTHDVALAWDSVAEVFGLFSAGKFHYISPKEVAWHTLDVELDPDLDNKPMRHHHIYDPVNNVHIATTARWKTVAFKFVNKPGNLSKEASPKP